MKTIQALAASCALAVPSLLQAGDAVSTNTTSYDPGPSYSTQHRGWYLGGGIYQPWSFGYVGRPSLGGRGLATQFDAGVAVKVSNNLSLEGFYGYANGKSVMQAIYPDGKNGSFGYIEANYTF